MVDIDFSYIETVVPKMFYVEPKGYKIIEEEIEGYVKTILDLDKDGEFDRLGTYEETIQEAKKKVETLIKKSM